MPQVRIELPEWTHTKLKILAAQVPGSTLHGLLVEACIEYAAAKSQPSAKPSTAKRNGKGKS